MSDHDTIAQGRAAWQRLKDRDRTTFEDWVCVGRALVEARRQCMVRAKVNSPFGMSYQKHMRKFLDTNDMADLDSHERYGAILVVEHLGEIEAYRATLTEAERLRCCHVNTVLKHWRAGSVPRPQGPQPKQPHIASRPCHDPIDSSGYGRPIDWPRAEHIRRAAQAVGETYGSRDTYKIATAALRAALRHEDDVLELLKPEKAAVKTAPVPAPLHA